ncbi:MAG: transposase [Chloroflexi bacterium]|nr:transposase [Chloroflexota bacterium]
MANDKTSGGGTGVPACGGGGTRAIGNITASWFASMKPGNRVGIEGSNKGHVPRAGFQPAKEFRIYRRNLPHWEQPGSSYLITFRTAKEFTLSDEARTLALNSVMFHADKKYHLDACVVMEDHVHLILRPLEESPGSFYSLAEIMHSIKSYSANRIQRVTGWMGAVWLDENLDRIIRSDNDWMEKLNYVVSNPVKAGLVERPEDYKWLYFVSAE